MENDYLNLVVYGSVVVLMLVVIAVVFLLFRLNTRRSVNKMLAVYSNNCSTLEKLFRMPIPQFLGELSKFLGQYPNTKIPIKLMKQAIDLKRDILAKEYREGEKGIDGQLQTIGNSIIALADFIISQLVDGKTGRWYLKSRKGYFKHLAEKLKAWAKEPREYFTHADPETGKSRFMSVTFILFRELKKGGAKGKLRVERNRLLKVLAENYRDLGKLEKKQDKKQRDVDRWKKFGDEHRDQLNDAFGKYWFDYPSWPEK